MATKVRTLLELARDMLDRSLVWNHEGLPLSASIEEGHPRVLVIAGENATGKSFLAQGLLSWGWHHHEIAPISVSMRERTGAGRSDMAGMRRLFMFGDESQHSTGATSARVVATAFRTLEARAQEKKRALLILDEPELGLSDGYAAAMGAYVASQCLAMPKLACGVAIVTHSRGLVRALATTLEQLPSFVKTGEAVSFEEWLKGERTRSVEDLLALPDIDHTHWRKMSDILDELRKPGPTTVSYLRGEPGR